MRCRLDYGKSGLDVELPQGVAATVVESPDREPLADAEGSIRRAIASPLHAPPLGEIARGRRDAVVVISDKTRPVPNGLVLPPILETLEEAGIPREKIEILVGTGLHRPNTPDELVEMTSPEIVARYRIRNHVARNPHEHRHLGRTERGTEIWLDHGYLDAGLKVVTGLVEPHLMAGYSGGRKGVAPGLAAVETMKSAHGVAMLEEHLGPGILEGNPFHEDLLEIARRAGVDFLVNVTIDRARRLSGVFAGDLERAHEAAVAACERETHVALDHPADVVVSSAGGYPLDTTFYQSIKGLIAALNVVRRGGTIILAAEISEGLGSPEFRDILAGASTPDALMAKIRSPGFFSIDQWMAQHLCQVLRKARVRVVSGCREPLPLAAPFVRAATSVESAIDEALHEHGRDARVVVLPEGPYLLATVRGRRLSLGRAWMEEAA
jgi:nickel-dependent lactate racemase